MCHRRGSARIVTAAGQLVLSRDRGQCQCRADGRGLRSATQRDLRSPQHRHHGRQDRRQARAQAQGHGGEAPSQPLPQEHVRPDRGG